LLGPYYAIHRLGVPGEEEAATDIARAVEATYPGYEPILPELGEVVVPDVVWFDRTTIYECLVSRQWKWGSMLDDRRRSPDAVDPGIEDEAPHPGAADVDEEELVKVRDLRGDRSTIYTMRLADSNAELIAELRRARS
jgi:hypothetical protein